MSSMCQAKEASLALSPLTGQPVTAIHCQHDTRDKPVARDEELRFGHIFCQPHMLHWQLRAMYHLRPLTFLLASSIIIINQSVN